MWVSVCGCVLSLQHAALHFHCMWGACACVGRGVCVQPDWVGRPGIRGHVLGPETLQRTACVGVKVEVGLAAVAHAILWGVGFQGLRVGIRAVAARWV